MAKSRSCKRFFRYYYLKIVRAKSSPEEISRGVSLGVFFTLMLTFGLGFIIAGIIAPYCKANRITAVSSALILKPIVPFMIVINTSFGIYITKFFGNQVIQTGTTDFNIFHGASLSVSLYIAALVGSIIIAGIIAVILYPLTLSFMYQYHERRKKKRLQNAALRHEKFLQMQQH